MPPKRQELNILMPKLIDFRMRTGFWPTQSTNRKLKNQLKTLVAQIRQGDLSVINAVRAALMEVALVESCATAEDLCVAMGNDRERAKQEVNSNRFDARSEQLHNYVAEHNTLPVRGRADSDAMYQWLGRAALQDPSLQDVVSKYPRDLDVRWEHNFVAAESFLQTHGFFPPENAETLPLGRWVRQQREWLRAQNYATVQGLLNTMDEDDEQTLHHILCEIRELDHFGESVVSDSCGHKDEHGKSCGHRLKNGGGSCPFHGSPMHVELQFQFHMQVADVSRETMDVIVDGACGERLFGVGVKVVNDMTVEAQESWFREHCVGKWFHMTVNYEWGSGIAFLTDVQCSAPMANSNALPNAQGKKDDRLKKLLSLFNPVALAARWDTFFERLEFYIVNNGCVPDIETDASLYLWIRQHVTSRGQLRAHREKLAELIGTNSGSAKEAWYKKIHEAETFLQTHGSLPGGSLGEWLEKQGRMAKELFLDRRLALAKLGMSVVVEEPHASLHGRLAEFKDLQGVIEPRVPNNELLESRGFKLCDAPGFEGYRDDWRLQHQLLCFPDSIDSPDQMMRICEMFNIGEYARDGWLALNMGERVVSCGLHTELLYMACRTCGAIYNPHPRTDCDFRMQHAANCSAIDESIGFFCCKGDDSGDVCHALDCPFHLENYGLASGAGVLALGVPQSRAQVLLHSQPEGVFFSRSCASEILIARPPLYTIPHASAILPGDPLVPCLDFHRDSRHSWDGGRTWHLPHGAMQVEVRQIEDIAKSVDSVGQEVLVHTTRSLDKRCCALELVEVRCCEKLFDCLDLCGRTWDGSGSVVENAYPELTKELLQMHLCRYTGAWRWAWQLFSEYTKYSGSRLDATAMAMYDILAVLLYTYEQWAKLAQIACRFALMPNGLPGVHDLLALLEACAENTTHGEMLACLLCMKAECSIGPKHAFVDFLQRLCSLGHADPMAVRVLKRFGVKS